MSGVRRRERELPADNLLAAGAHEKVYASPDASECSEFERRGFTSVRSTLEQFVAR